MQAPIYREIIYYDVQISNVEGDSAPAPQLNFYESRSEPYLENSGLYNMSIVRFQLDTPSLPIFVPTIQVGQPNANLTIYSITLSYQGHDYQSYISYTPQDTSIPIPQGPSNTSSGVQDNAQRYYNIFSFQWFVNMINQSFVEAMNNMINDFPTGLPSTNAPFMNWDITSNSAILNADQAGYQTDIASPISIYFNSSLYNLYSSFLCLSRGYQATNGKNYQFVVNDYTTGSNTVQLPIVNPTYTAVQLYQEYSTISLFSPISSICFTTSNLPIVSSQMSNPATFTNGVLVSSSSSASYTKIITDMIANDSFYKPTLIYEPTVYRQIQMTGNTQLRDLQLSVQWKDKQGVMHPFYLYSGSASSIKLLFTLKK
ncbi:MAG: phage minor capsid protein [Pseudomonadota bacterium]